MLKQIKRPFIAYLIIQLLVVMINPGHSFAADPNVTYKIVVQRNTVSVSGTVEVSDSSYKVTSMEMIDKNGNSKPITIGSGTSWSYSFPTTFSDGVYSYTIRATAQFKNNSNRTLTSNTNLTFTVDTTAPTMTVSSPSLQSKNVVISGTVTDAGTASNLLTLELLESNLTSVAGAVLTGPDA